MKVYLYMMIAGFILVSCGKFGKKKSNSNAHSDAVTTEVEEAIEQSAPEETVADSNIEGSETGTDEGEANAMSEPASSAPAPSEAQDVEVVEAPPPSVLRTKTEFKAAVARMWGHKQSEIDATYILVQNSLPASNIAEGNIHPEFLTAIARLSSSACDLFWMKQNDSGDWNDSTTQEVWMSEILSRAYIKEEDKAKAKMDLDAQLLISSELSNSEKFSLSCSVVTASKAFL